MKIEIRPIHASNRSEWETLWQGYLTFYNSKVSNDQTDLTWQRLLDSQFNLHGLVAVCDGVLVGVTHYLFHPSSWTSEDYCYLQDLFVSEAARSQGIGRALIQGVIETAKRQPAQRVYWLTQENNQTARKLYDKVSTATGFIQYRIAPL